MAHETGGNTNPEEQEVHSQTESSEERSSLEEKNFNQPLTRGLDLVPGIEEEDENDEGGPIVNNTTQSPGTGGQTKPQNK